MFPLSSKSAMSNPRTALAALRLTFRCFHLHNVRPTSSYSSSTKSQTTSESAPDSSTPSSDLSDPLNPQIPLSPLGLPLHPLPLPLPSIQAPTMTREALHRLHRLSALNPPPEGSTEEMELLEGLKGLVGLMDAVKAVELPEGGEGYGSLLGRGVGELVLDFEKTEDMQGDKKSSDQGEKKRGRELLQYATRRVGDYYASRLPPKTES